MFLFQNIKDNLFLCCFVGSIALILLLSIFRINKKGSWSSQFFIEDTPKKNKHKKTKRSSDSRGEIECRRVLESLFKRPFKKERPSFLRNDALDNGMNLELDCYNRELKLAVEYNGRQHYQFIPFFHKNKDAFQNQKYRDFIKKQRCKEHNITLITVPYTIKIKDIRSFLVRALREKKIIR